MRKLFILLLCALFATPVIQAQPIANHVILIGLDGWAAHDLDKAHDIPNLRSLMAGGAYSMHKRSVIPSSSAVNWASMFMGAGPEMHGYTTWGSKTPEVPCITTNKNGIFPTIFSAIHEQRPEAETGCTFEWDGIKYVIDTLSISHIEYFKEGWKNVEENCDKIVQYIENKRPVFFAPCFDGIDGIGHEKGWYTEDYYEYLVRIDQCVGRIIQALKDGGIYDDTVIIVTGDHGGHEKGHGTLDLRDMESPLVFFGKNVRAHHQLEEPIVQYDIAATIAYILGVDTPEAWRGKPVKQAFE
jgi:predicted AlkP superfamily pyrophosphatase or phosphodiesterase